MRYVLTAEEARAREQAAVASGAVTLDVLMERAGGELAAEVARCAPSGDVAVVTGKGNNGGDGWVASRALAGMGRAVRVLALAPPDSLAGPAATAAADAVRAGVTWADATGPGALAHGLAGASAVVDAIFGVGFSGVAREPYAAAIRGIENARRSGALVIAADVPSGVDADTGAVDGPAVIADVTVAFGSMKVGLLVFPGATHAGDSVVADIGLGAAEMDAASRATNRPAPLELWETAEYRALLPAFPSDAHKGSRGHVLVVAGSHRYAGAAVLACAGASRMGAGLTRAAVPAPVVPVLQAALPHVIAADVPTDAAGALDSTAFESILDLARDADALVLGPGLGLGEGVQALVPALMDALDVPLVLDADALNVLALAAESGRALGLLDAREARGAATVLTPHPGEAARLLGITTDDVQRDRLAAARALAATRRACVLKGARTIVADAGRSVITLAGNPGMASAGTGDVLAGIVGTLVAQGLQPFDAGALGAFLHARAGDLAAAALTTTCVVASDLPWNLPKAVAELLRGAPA